MVSEDVIEWLLEPENPSMKYRTRALIPEDGYYVFELGVVNVNAYFPGKSVGFWTFSATVISP
ncbi:MAG TPA: hypothetical protein VMT42_03995 [candidate division Zixibacteria bacterium]|nr:hypothetical protein [candidate division Zixibacteria bacterium]